MKLKCRLLTVYIYVQSIAIGTRNSYVKTNTVMRRERIKDTDE